MNLLLASVVMLLSDWHQGICYSEQPSRETPPRTVSVGPWSSPCADSTLLGLNALCDSTAGRYWLNHTGWNNSELHCCEWYGVECDEDSNVVALHLDNNNVTGHVPFELAEALASSLTNLTLSSNSILSLPDNVGLLHKLQELDVSENVASLNLPASIGNMSVLKILHVGNNSLYPDPYSGVAGVPVPDSIAQLKHLEVLNLSHNSLYDQLTPQVFELPNLKVLDLGLGTLLIYFPPSGVREMKHLQHLNLDHNEVQEIPDSIGELSELVSLSVNAMPGVLHGVIPQSIGRLSKLEYLSIANNYNMDGPVPLAIWNLTSLRYMDISYNGQRGQWPESFTGFTSLKYLDMGAMFFGYLPDIFSPLVSLKHFAIRTNQLTGPIPPSITTLDQLTFLNLAGNYLNGTIPESTNTFFSRLSHCELEDNSFKCPIASAAKSKCGGTCT